MSSEVAGRRIKVFRDAEKALLERHPQDQVNYKELLGLYYKAMRGVQRVYNLQIKEDFDPPDMSEDELMEAANDPARPDARNLLSPYVLRRRENGILVAKKYRDIPKFRRALNSAARGLASASNYLEERAGEFADPREVDLMQSNLSMLDPAFRNGSFRNSRHNLLSMRQLPELMFDAGLSDRYAHKLGLGFAGQGWIGARNDEATAIFGERVRRAQDSLAYRFGRANGEDGQRNLQFQLFVGDAIAYGGLAKIQDYRGNTMPSEDDLRQESAISYIFENRVRAFVRKVLAPNFSKYIQGPPLTEEELIEATMMVMAGHEAIGHVFVDVANPEFIRSHITSLKEGGSDLISHAGLLRSTTRENEHQILNALKVAFAWMRADIEEYNKTKSSGLRPYAVGAAYVLNLHNSYQSIVLDERDRIDFPSLSMLEGNSLDFAQRISDVTHEEPYDLGSTDRFIRACVNDPMVYIPDMLSSGDQSSRDAVAA